MNASLEIVPRHGPAAVPGPRDRRPFWIALLVAGAFFMENLDGTVITTAMPAMAASFRILPVDLNVGVSAYLLTLAVFIPASGWIADRFGARRIFATAVVIFTGASLLCGVSQGLGEFVAVRVLQGIGGAMMVPVGRLVVLKNTPKERLIGAIATLTWPALVAPVLGPPLGGILTSYAGWRWIFYLNLPLGIAALVASLALIPDNPPAPRRRFDGIGFVLGGLAILSLMGGVELIGRDTVAWGPVIACGTIGAILFAGTVRHLNRTVDPMISFAALKVATYAVTIQGGSLCRMAIFAAPFLLPLMFQVGFGLDPVRSGLLVIAVFAGNLMMKPATTPILRRFGFKTVLVGNGVLNALSLLACAFIEPTTPVPVIVLILFVGGLTRSMQFTAVNTIAFADVAAADMTAANTLFSTISQLSSGLGVALGAIGIRLGHGFWLLTGITAPQAGDFRLAFVLVAVVALIGVLDSLRLDRAAGDHVARRRS
ncbi:MAG: MFS transporter [Azospirillaceae bacterium]|nr:MFS transporter [Azospirillaceae bacterium]